MNRLALAMVSSLLAVGLAAPATAAEAPERSERTKSASTRFALGAFGLGTAVRGGSIPAESGKTSYRIIGCTNRTGVERSNHVAEADVPGLGTVSGVKTEVWTAGKGDNVSSNAVHSIGKIVLGDRSAEPGELTIKAIESRAWAYHNETGYHARYQSSIGQIVYRPFEGAPEILVVPSPGQTLEVPGLARIKLGSKSKHKGPDGARSYTTALKIEVIPSDTLVRVAHVSAKIAGGVKEGLFRGSSNATRASALDGIVTSGPQPHLPMPCQGTGGEVRTNDLAELDLGGQIVAGALNTELMGDQTKKRAWGYTKSSIAEVDLGGGQLVITGIVGKANVDRRGSKVIRNSKGTTVGSITADGEAQEFPDPGQALVIPGLAAIELNVTKKTKTGIKVTSVLVTLLDGTGAEIHLGQAELSIRSANR